MSVTIVDWETIKDHFVKKNLKNDLDVSVVEATLAKIPAISVSDVKLAFNASASLTIALFNDPQDADEDGVVGAPRKLPDGTVTPPLIASVSNKAWLRYRVAGSLRAGVAAKLQSVGIALDAESSLVLSDYRVHDPADDAGTAVFSDLSSPRTVFKLADVLAMAPNEALLYRLRGTLGSTVTLTLADVFTKTASALASLVPTESAAAIRVEAGLKCSFKIEVTDDFLLTIAALDQSQMRVVVRKASGRGVAIREDIGIKAEFANPEELGTALNAWLTSVVGDDIAKVDEILKQATPPSEDSVKGRVIALAIKRLGLEDAQNKLDAARTKIAELKKSAEAAIKSVATAKAALAFQYEYTRLDTRKTLCDATVRKSAFDTQMHRTLVRQDLSHLLAASQTDNSVTLSSYLDERKVERSRSWGFTLGIGKWSVSEKDVDTLTSVTRFGIDPQKMMISYVGARGYTTKGAWPAIKENMVDFRAEMTSYRAEPRASDFDFGLSIITEEQAKKLTSSRVVEILDTATMWRLITLAEADDLRAQLPDEARASVSYHIAIEEVPLRAIMVDAGTVDAKAMGRALAAAMPWMSFAVRRSWESRAGTYGSLWQALLEGATLSPSEWSRAAANAVRTVAPDAAVPFEGNVQDSSMGRFAKLIEGHPRTVGNWRAFVRGAALLSSALTDGREDYWKITQIFDDMKQFWSQSLYIRALGYHLMNSAARAGVLADVGRTLRIEWEADEGTQVINVGSNG